MNNRMKEIIQKLMLDSGDADERMGALQTMLEIIYIISFDKCFEEPGPKKDLLVPIFEKFIADSHAVIFGEDSEGIDKWIKNLE